MSREVSKGEEAVWWALRTGWGWATSLLLLTAAALLAEHLKRKIDAGLVHWPFQPGRRVYLGVTPVTGPPAEYTVNPPPSGTPAPQVPGPYQPPAPVPGVDWGGTYNPGVVNLGGLLGVNRP